MVAVLLFVVSFVELIVAFEADVQKRCFSCTVFTAINNRLICTNPGVCYSDYCYSYLLSNKQPMFLAGCAEDASDFPFRKDHDDRTLCHTRGAVGLCVCRAGAEPCNQEPPSKLFWFDTDITRMNAISHRVAGFSADYGKSRVGSLMITDFPDNFEGSPLNSAPSPIRIFAIALVAVLSI